MRCRFIIFSLAFSLLICLFARGENWPQWRGPHQNGVAAGKDYPTKWGEEENVVWKVKIPGWGTSTPAIWGDKLFASGEVDGKNALICLDRQGKELWQAKFGEVSGNRNRKASAANPSPVTDGRHVYTYYKSGDLACVDFDGKTVWQTNLQEKYGPDRLLWDLGTSPVLTDKSIVVAVMHNGPSYIAALDKSSGKQVWKHDRDLDAPGESADSYTTPLLMAPASEPANQPVLVVLGADHVTAHSLADGKELWRIPGLNPNGAGNFRSIASPVAIDQTVIAPYARGGSLTAIQLQSNDKPSAKPKVSWTLQSSSADVPSPVAYQGNVYVCGDRGEVTCVNVQSGKEVWTHRLPRNRYAFSSSPIIADGKLYLTREDGTTFVLQLENEPTLLATNSLRENTYATPAFVDGRIYLRTSDYMFCIGKK